MKKILYIAVAFAALCAISCKQEMELHPVGSRIVFSAATEFKNGLETKTIYSGDYTQTTPNYERIQWVDNDPIRILYSHGGSTSADYVIDGTTITGTGSAKKSTASISASGTPLEWAEGNSHVFYGLYPSSAGTLTAGSVTGLSIPDRQTVIWDATQSKYLPATFNADSELTMTNAYMVAYKDMTSDPNGSVSLPFTPVVNAIEFQLKLPDTRPSYTVSKVRLSHGTTAIAGSYNVSITGFADDAVTWSASSTSTTKAIIVDFKNGSTTTNPAIPTSTSGNVLDFTILTLPVAISNPTLEIRYSDNDVMTLTLTGLTMQPGQKCIVTNSKAGHDHFTYTVNTPASQTITGHDAASFQQINVTSLKRSGANSSYTEPVAWKVQYSTDSGNTWTDGVPSTHTISEDHTNNRFTVSLAAANSNTTGYASGNPFQAATEILKARSERGSTDSPWDLSTHDWAGNSISQTTANCYVVTAPGVYKIPLYYGNARLNGQDNTSAYSPKDVSAINSAWGSGNTDATQNYYLPAFYNATGEVITSPNIYTDLSHYGTTTLTQAVSLDMDLDIITNCEVKGSGASAYIQFTITKANIKPGNVRLILKGGVNNYFTTDDTWPVLWSWHIWITDKDLAPASGSTVMPFNLGWVDANTTVSNSVDKYTNRTVTLRIAQVEGGSEVNYGSSFTLTQNGDVAAINNPMNGTNPHYQWGRKDPFSFNKSTVQLSHWSDAGPYVYWRGIRVPDVMIKSEKSTTWMDGKAIPLYKQVSTVSSYTLAAAKYGPFTLTQKNTIAGILGSSGWSTRHRVTYASNSKQFFSQTVYNWAHTTNQFVSYPIPDWTQQGVVYYINEGSILTDNQLTTLSNLCTNYGIDYTYNFDPYWIIMNDYNNFVNNNLEDVYYITLSSAVTVSPAQKTTLNNAGLTTGFTPNYTNSDEYTTDAERKLGSILHNLWSAALYNENANVTKYKTVYDPCPAGFTVPTKATYNSGTFTYPLTGRRYNNNSSSGNVSVTDNGTKGYYWTDNSCNMSYNSGAKDVITSYSDYDKSYILETTSSTATVKKNIRATAASIRPMVDPQF